MFDFYNKKIKIKLIFKSYLISLQNDVICNLLTQILYTSTFLKLKKNLKQPEKHKTIDFHALSKKKCHTKIVPICIIRRVGTTMHLVKYTLNR